jgi:hypothetical protein
MNYKNIKTEIDKLIIRNTDQANEYSSYAFISNNHEFLSNSTISNKELYVSNDKFT